MILYLLLETRGEQFTCGADGRHNKEGVGGVRKGGKEGHYGISLIASNRSRVASHPRAAQLPREYTFKTAPPRDRDCLIVLITPAHEEAARKLVVLCHVFREYRESRGISLRLSLSAPLRLGKN